MKWIRIWFLKWRLDNLEQELDLVQDFLSHVPLSAGARNREREILTRILLLHRKLNSLNLT